ncbi:cytoplasmic protein NCK1-like isoform X2 [Amphibalanus amphitrite]|uniref:cytoplasmic protein NCK1-like isoform X2 n=1 Tax=Amphibalanus amphitrite TaxID=1232801 RepID=UPI001C915A38|nr:cytoplasmic protein NCK1-like isoform X2 [Amphibalanus amphitrite]
MSSLKHGQRMGAEECWVTAKYDYEAQGTHELSLRKQERLLLLDDSKHWWRVMNGRQQCGYVPSNYVKKEKPSIFDSIKKRVKKSGGSRTLPSGTSDSQPATPSPHRQSSNQPPPQLVDPAEAMGVALVKYNYQAQQRDELSLTKGTKVLILEKSNDGWWKGQYNAQVGWFPSNYTQEEEQDDTLHLYTMAENVLDVVMALYTFQATQPQELSFQKNERLEVLDRPANDPEWLMARNGQGTTGLIPRNYVRELGRQLSDGKTNGNGAASGGPSGAEDPVPSSELAQLRLGAADASGERPHLAGKDWYFGPVSRSQADQLLATRGQDGCFLVRDSETNVGDYSVSLKAPGRNKHFRVEVKGALYCIGQRKFHTLDQLVDHYQRCPIYTNPQGEKLYLIRPLPRQ